MPFLLTYLHKQFIDVLLVKGAISSEVFKSVILSRKSSLPLSNKSGHKALQDNVKSIWNQVSSLWDNFNRKSKHKCIPNEIHKFKASQGKTETMQLILLLLFIDIDINIDNYSSLDITTFKECFIWVNHLINLKFF